MQSSLNAIWKTKPQDTTVSRLIRARAVSLGLVAALGFLLIVSLAVSAGLTAFGDYLDTIVPIGKLILPVFNFFGIAWFFSQFCSPQSTRSCRTVACSGGTSSSERSSRRSSSPSENL